MVGAILMWCIYVIIPILILFFVIKFAVKSAIRELKEENII